MVKWIVLHVQVLMSDILYLKMVSFLLPMDASREEPRPGSQQKTLGDTKKTIHIRMDMTMAMHECWDE
jgi:hypothetical protein